MSRDDLPLATHSAQAMTSAAPLRGVPLSAASLDAYSKAILASGPRAYYRLNDARPEALDSSNDGLNGTIGSNVATGSGSIIASTSASAMHFPGAKQRAAVILVPATTKLTPKTNLSMETFLRFSSVPANYTVPLSYGTDVHFAPYDIYFTTGGVLNAQFYLTTGLLVVTAPKALLPSTDYDIVATFDGATGRLYINGVQVAAALKTGSLTSYDSTHGLALGDDAGFSDPAFAGTLQAVAIYTKTLTATDVATHYRASLGITPPPPTPSPGPTATPAPKPSATPIPPSRKADWLTYHANSLRTGWNAHEVALNTTTVAAGKFGLQAVLPVDGQVYAEPLVAARETVPAIGIHDLLIVATENDSVYAFDAQSGAPIWKRSFIDIAADVTPVPAVDAGCTNVYPHIGITSTPVIDRARDTIYLVAATKEPFGNHLVTHIWLHAISLSNGAEKKNVEIGGSYPQTGGGTISFVPQWQMNRASLLEDDGDIYVGFGSHCDYGGVLPHGWLFGYDAGSLAPQARDFLTTADPNPRGLTLGSIWGSGFGPTADASGNIYFATGNGAAYDGKHSFTQSVLKLSPTLGFPEISSFTPSTQASENTADRDLGSGGVMLLPDQPGPVPHIAIAGGKNGMSYVLNRDALGGYTQGGPDHIPYERRTNGGIYGGPAYFVGADGKPYLVICGGNDQVMTYLINTAPLALVPRTHAKARIGSSEGGTIPVVSSNGTKAGTAIVWAVSRPGDTTTPIVLNAYDGADLEHELYSAPTQPWNNPNGDVLITPTVANGKVYVPTATAVYLFGLK